MSESSDNEIIGASPNDAVEETEFIGASPNYGEVVVALHAIVAKKIGEKAAECRLELEPFCEQILERLVPNDEFKRTSYRLSVRGTQRSLYLPNEARSTIVIFKTRYFADDVLCRELLTSYGIGLLHKPELSRLEISLELKLAAMV